MALMPDEGSVVSLKLSPCNVGVITRKSESGGTGKTNGIITDIR
jgi:hypothetical protein